MKKMPEEIIILQMCTINDNHWCLVPGIWRVTDRIFYHFGSFFALPPSNQKIRILKNWKKTPTDIIILHMCTINDNHMMYGSWDMEHNRNNFCHFGPFFALYPSNNPKNKNFWKHSKKKKKKNSLEILHISAINDNHMMHGFWDMECNRQFFVVLDHFMPFYPPKQPKKSKFWKIQKKDLETLSFYTCVP